jgi:catechol 2,3-dioxygenase-like lactoylglutathione lyase family enzyme
LPQNTEALESMSTPKDSSATGHEATSLPSAILETCLHVEDLGRSREFYADLFGYPVMMSDDRFCAFNVGGGQVLLLFVRGSDPYGTILTFGTIPPHGTSGQAHVGFSVSCGDLSAWKERLIERGIAIESIITWPAGGTSIYFRDPDGHLLELLTPGVWPNY